MMERLEKNKARYIEKYASDKKNRAIISRKNLKQIKRKET